MERAVKTLFLLQVKYLKKLNKIISKFSKYLEITLLYNSKKYKKNRQELK